MILQALHNYYDRKSADPESGLAQRALSGRRFLSSSSLRHGETQYRSKTRERAKARKNGHVPSGFRKA